MKVVFAFILLPLYICISGYNRTTAYIEWNSIHEIEQVVKEDQKKVIIKLYASWCKPCQKLGKTFEDQSVLDFLKEDYHLVNFEIQSKDVITYKGKTYGYTKDLSMNVNELAYEFMEEKLSFPVVVILDQNLDRLEIFRGYQSPEDLIEKIKSI